MPSALLVGLTGGIGAGKSTVARTLAAHGARVVDGDAAARDIVDPQRADGAELLQRIAALLGPGALRASGALDRTAVASRVFGDDDLRQRYNALIRPALLAEVARLIAAATAAPGVVVHEIPLLRSDSAPLPWRYDLVVTIEAQEGTRIRRLIEHRGHDADEAARRVRAQGDEAGRAAIADIVIRTDGTPEDTRRAADALWVRLSAARPPRR